MFGDELAPGIRERFAEFVRTRVNPGATGRDDTDTPISRELMKEAADVGLLGMTFPTEVGGQGLDYGSYGVVLEQLGYLCEELSFPSLLSLYPDVARMIYNSGRSELIDRYVRPMCRGDRFGCFAYTDGTDAFTFATQAKKVDGGYVITGGKSMQTGGLIADTFLTYTSGEDRDLLLFIVEKDDPGVEIAPVPCMGMRGAGISKLTLHDVFVTDDRLLVSGDGLSHAQRFLNTRRIFLICGAMGRLESSLEDGIKRMRETERYGNSLLDLNNVQAAIGRMAVLLETARTLMRRALELVHHGEHERHFDLIITMAKYVCVENALAFSQQLLRVMGGRAYTRNLPYERQLRDFYGGVMGGGTQDVLEINLGVEVISEIERRARKERSS